MKSMTQIDQLFVVITQLTALIAEENTLLAAGLPATAAGSGERKERLSERFNVLWGSVTCGGKAALAAHPDTLRRLIAAVMRLQMVTNENLVRLDNALAASHRRVDRTVAVLHPGAACLS